MAAIPEDAAIREQALQADQSFIVQAPAGSGKTELLTRRVLTLLAIVDKPEEVLAITFTRKAAVEMQTRVFEALQLAATEAPAEDAYQAEGIALANAVLQRDKQQGWELLSNPQRLNLRTIDSLGTALAHNLPIVSKLGAPSSVVDDASALYREAAANFLNKHLESFDLVLLHLGNKLVDAERLLAEMLGKRDQWDNYVNNDLSTDVLRAGLEAVLLGLVESRLEALVDSAPAGFIDKLLPLINFSQEMKALLDDSGTPTLFEQSPGSSIDHLGTWRVFADCLLTADVKKPAIRKRITRANGFPTNAADAKVVGLSAKELGVPKKQIVELLETISDYPAFIELINEVRTLPYPEYDDIDWQVMEQLINTLPLLLNELEAVFASVHQVDFTEIAIRAKKAMGEEDEPTDLALAMDLRISHILVDEFQDTSLTQFSLFQQLVAGWQPGDGKTFFAVGDPMQSIYRFRNAKVTLFALAQNEGIGATVLTPLALTVNFRSSPSVTNWINHVFADLFPAESDDVTGATAYAHSVAFKDLPGSVTVHPNFNSSVEDEASQVAQLVKTAVDSSLEHTVAILVRSRGQATEIYPALQKLGVRYQAVDMDNLGEKPVVRDLLSLTLALRYPHDRLHWLAVVRAPWCGLTAADLNVLMDDSAQTPVIELLQDTARISNMSDDGALRVQSLLRIMLPAVQRSARSTIIPWVESCWLKLGGPAVCRDQSDLDASEQCLKKLQQMEARGLLWRLGSLHDAMKKLYAVGDVGDDNHVVRVQIMTMHKAKGLEFDTVVMPALHRRPRGDTKQLLSWFDSPGDFQLLLAPFNEVNKDPSPILKLVRSANDRCNVQEVIRLLYVACTRSKQHLHLLGTTKHSVKGELNSPAKSSLLGTLWPIIETEFENADPGAPPAFDEEAVEAPVAAPRLQRLPVDWQMPAMNVYQGDGLRPEDTAEVPSIDYLWASTAARDIGTVVHAQLQRMAVDPSARGPEQLKALSEIATCQLRSLGMPESELKQSADKVIRAISNTLEDDRGQWILDPSHEQAMSEWALTANTHEGLKSVVIDRTFIDKEGARWIIDFKTGDHSGGSLDTFLDQEQERYNEQLIGYADILRLSENRPIRMGLYFPLLKAFREIPAGSLSSRGMTVDASSVASSDVISDVANATLTDESDDGQGDAKPIQTDMFSSE